MVVGAVLHHHDHEGGDALDQRGIIGGAAVGPAGGGPAVGVGAPRAGVAASREEPGGGARAGQGPDALEREARRQGMITIREDGMLKVLDGRIGLEQLAQL